MKIEAEVDGKVLVYSSSLTMNPNGKLVFNFDNEARITVVFISEDTGDNGNRLVKSTVDDDGLGMTISCYNFKMYSPREEGLASEPQFIFTKNNKKHYFNFRTNLFNSESRWISINFLRDK
ncbi:hypothetical protein WBU40_004767 [Escherichia coli]|jgi:hypothetical protein|uniref:Uncharacterized protein n=12 Tax=Bacteria TaxID=2 RepID=A0A5T4KKQ6_SALAN|nr:MULTISPECIES: hypothetical protein [Bacteria]EAA8817923.1 hypothetical protein [Salmonella enterica subsp. enterica serovar Cerro]EAB0236939.1 hypothetical protein [Salmonella enterica subsp. enterica serovar Anatum]EAC1694980.1 hypothetical protein [Salmonella enterica subsp. enterica serovar Schwarzengrund]EAM2918215.1 hypothetical protein [Salmonella enterica]EAM5576859.1 hypothetical protein [Salmonella enterica subsp. enterica serovar Adelaide]EAU2789755.1 hypothetical protein [Salmon